MADYQIKITTRSRKETQKLGEKIGNLLNKHMVIGLSGELGSGKTAFVQGLGRGLEVPVEYYITSPTFTLINEYPGRLRLFHVDLYRLEKYFDLEEIGLDDILRGNGVVAIEWADKLPENYFRDHLTINFEIIDDDSRQIKFFAYGHHALNLISALET